MLKIGWSKRDISTDKPVPITGQFHVRVSKGVLDPVMLYCLVLDDGNDLVVFLSGDFVGGRGISLDTIREKVAARDSLFPTEKILFNVTHTHCGPGLMKENPYKDIPHEGFDVADPVEYFEFFTDQAADAVLEAYASRKEGAIAYGYGYAVVGHSRRTTYFDDYSLRDNANQLAYKSLVVHGHAVMYGNTDDTQFAGYENGADHFVNLLYTFDENQKLTGAIINVPCPSQNSEHESYLTADYWHDVRTILKEKYGDIFVLSQCAAAGDLSPRILHYKRAQERRYALKYGETEFPEKAEFQEELRNRRDIAQRICAAFDEVLPWASKDMIRDAKVLHTVRDIQLQRWLISDADYQQAKEELEKIGDFQPQKSDDLREDFHRNSLHSAGVNRFKNIVRRYEAQKEDPCVGMELHAIRVGDIAFTSNPFELYMDFQHRIQARSPFVQTFIIQLCDTTGKRDSSGYLATERGEANVGYSANIFSNNVSYEGGQTLVEETLRALNELADPT